MSSRSSKVNFFIQALVIGLIGLSTPYLAQAVTDPTQGAALITTTSPEHPEPGDTVTVSLTSYLIDLNRAVITWKLNGSILASGPAETSQSFTVGAAGSATSLEISTTNANGSPIIKNILFRPATVDLVWESNTPTPWWYTGKAVPAVGDNVTVTAVPQLTAANGQPLPDSTLIYQWKKAGQIVMGSSGLGKSSLTTSIDANNTENNRISVRVSNTNESIVAEKSIRLSPPTPQIFIYQADPSLGIHFWQALSDSLTLENNELSIIAVPFGLATNNRFAWAMNDRPIAAASGDGLSLTFRTPENSTGRSRISLTATTPDFKTFIKTFFINFQDTSFF